MKLLRIFALTLVSAGALAAPFTPADDAQIVERLPISASDPSIRRVDSLRKQLAARPDDIPLRIEIARRYFDLAMAQGDPRYVGYASATLLPISQTAANNAQYWTALGLLQQYSHNFSGAIKSLEKASELDPRAVEPITWRAAISMVQADYPRAAAECARLVPLTERIQSLGCSTYHQATTGNLASAYETLSREFGEGVGQPPEFALWIRTRLAEMATRLRKLDDARRHFAEARKLGVTDQFLLAAYADFLLMQNQPAEVIALLTEWEKSDILLLRLALASKAAKDPKAQQWANALRDRFTEAARRGDSLHEQEAARFELDIEGSPTRALSYATKNYLTQKEPRDAEILMRASLAANSAKSAQPALDWLRTSKYEDPVFAAMADKLVAAGASR